MFTQKHNKYHLLERITQSLKQPIEHFFIFVQSSKQVQKTTLLRAFLGSQKLNLELSFETQCSRHKFQGSQIYTECCHQTQ